VKLESEVEVLVAAAKSMQNKRCRCPSYCRLERWLVVEGSSCQECGEGRDPVEFPGLIVESLGGLLRSLVRWEVEVSRGCSGKR